ncbi:MAG: acetylglutamate kinase [Candidatus Kapabacteria bacterium]|jgi:acetylglutamate kinase|nr:acetylglutamate kinase [Candidatus Kapabacteria bacterium]
MNTIVIKIGGNVVDDDAALSALLDGIAALERPVVLVHGGGIMATRLAQQLGIPQTMVHGRRVTDAATLDIAVMTYAGAVNKRIVANLGARGVPCIGMCGADMDLIRAHRRPIQDVDFGYVGDVESVRTDVLRMFLDSGTSVVCAPITHDGNGQLLNTNADTIASACASALGPNTELIYTFELPGVLTDRNDPTSVLPILTRADFARLTASNRITGGMIPKIDNAFDALDAGVARVRITRHDKLTEGTIIQ